MGHRESRASRPKTTQLLVAGALASGDGDWNVGRRGTNGFGRALHDARKATLPPTDLKIDVECKEVCALSDQTRDSDAKVIYLKTSSPFSLMTEKRLCILEIAY